MSDACIFCKIVKSEIPSGVVHETDHFLVIRDVNPRAKGHSLVIPKEHFETFLDMPSELYQEFLQTTREAVEKLLKETGASGYNLAMNNKKVAEQVVPHVHFHILPRREGDGLNLWH